MHLTLKDLLALVTEGRALYAEYQKAAADGNVSTVETIALASKLIDLLVKHNITLADLRELLTEIAPLLPLIQGK